MNGAAATAYRAAAPARRIGRFVLVEEIGRGAQATVWRAHDERLDREVALKLLRPDADSAAVSRWLHEARAVSRLAHPNIVPVFEADDGDGRSYLVFELVRGCTLADLRRRRGALPPREAATLMLGVLDALRAAHDQGIVHRDLKPSNVLVDVDGRARVMDFGIAARVADAGDARVVGTPGYMSPEAAQGMAPLPCMDVFSAGMVLADLLAGGPILREADSRRSIERVIHEDLALPAGPVVDDALRGIVNRAIARNSTLRYDSAGAFREALMRWLDPEAVAEPGAGADARGTLAFLLRRMRHRSDFPALSEAVVRIRRVTASEHQSLGSLADEILKDVALTHKLLRLVNSAYYGGGGGVCTVSRAVALVGVAGIRNLALSLVLLEHMKDRDQAARLKAEFLRALLAGQIASELARDPREREEAFLGAMFRHLGRLLAEFYFPDEAEQVRERAGELPDDPDLAAQHEQSAAEQVLGIDYEALGLGVARSWGLPESLQQCMRQWDGPPPQRPAVTTQERLRRLATLAHEAAAMALASPGADRPVERLKPLTDRHGQALGLDLPELQQAIARAEARLEQTAPAMGLVLPASPRRPDGASTAAAGADPDTLAPYALDVVASRPPSDHGPPAKSDARSRFALLAAGIHDVSQSMAAEKFQLGELLRMILETMYRGLRLRRALLCVRDPRSQDLCGRFGLGDDAMALAQHFHVPLRPARERPADLFSNVCLKGIDTLIADARAPAIAARLPDWYQARIGASAFLLLPLLRKGSPFALIYADMDGEAALDLGEEDFALVRTLRNQAVIAFRTNGG